MNNLTRRSCLFVCVVPLFGLVGCASNSQRSSGFGTTETALLGAGVGGIAGNLLGRGSNRNGATVAGALIGGALGAGYGNAMENRDEGDSYRNDDRRYSQPRYRSDDRYDRGRGDYGDSYRNDDRRYSPSRSRSDDRYDRGRGDYQDRDCWYDRDRGRNVCAQ